MEQKPQAQNETPEEEEGEDAEVVSYLLTYEGGGPPRRVWTDEEPDQVLQRWLSLLGKGTGPKVLRFPREGVLTETILKSELLKRKAAAGDPEAAAELKVLKVDEEKEVEIDLPVVLARAEKILDIASFPEEFEEEDDLEDDGEDEAPAAPPAPEPKGGKTRTVKSNPTSAPARLPAGFSIG